MAPSQVSQLKQSEPQRSSVVSAGAEEASRVNDLLHMFLSGAEGTATPATRVARALRQFFVARDVAVAMERYHTANALGTCTLTSSARVATLRGDPTDWDQAEAVAFLEHMAVEPWPARPVQISPVNWCVQLSAAEAQIVVGIAWADENAGFIVWCRLRKLSDFARASTLAAALDRDLSNMRLFASAIRSVQHVERVESEQQRMLRLRRELDGLLLAAAPREHSDLRSALSMIEELTSSDWCSCHVVEEPLRRIGALVLNRTLQASEPPDLLLLQDVASRLSNVRGAAEELRCIAQVISPQLPSGLPDLMWLKAAEPLSAMRLLSLAACELQFAKQISTLDEERSCAVERLPKLCQVIHRSLPKLLCQAARSSKQHAWPLEWVRIWLRLWFVYDVASIHFEPNAMTNVRTLVPEHVAVLRGLAATLLECLREQQYTGTPAFCARPEVLRDGLLLLVQHHAHRKSSVPRELDLPGHFNDVASTDQGNVEAIEHLDHILDVYITGYFVANLRLGVPRAGGEELQRVALHILGQVELGPSPKASADFSVAYALAALFHDSGMLLFPRLPSEQPVHDADDVAQALACIRNTVNEAGRTLVDTCVRELERHECIDRTQEPALEAWVERQRVHGTPDHALLSAWYLLRACTRAACLRPEVIRMAVRATLLHGALGVQIDSSENAVAALLVVCDEICDWEPWRAAVRPLLRDGRLLNERELPNLRVRGGRARTLGITGFWCEQEAGELRVGLDPAAGTWPHIAIGLRPPRELAHSVLELWLRSAQNIGRIRPAASGWSPSITLEGQVPHRLHAVGQNTRTLLDAIAQRTRSALRGRLHRWLENAAVFSDRDDESTHEAVTLIGLGRPIASDDVVHYLPDLLETAHQIIEERERSLRPR